MVHIKIPSRDLGMNKSPTDLGQILSELRAEISARNVPIDDFGRAGYLGSFVESVPMFRLPDLGFYGGELSWPPLFGFAALAGNS